MSARITTAALAARIDANDATLSTIVTNLAALTQAVTALAQFATPAAVAEKVAAPAPKTTPKARSSKTAKQVKIEAANAVASTVEAAAKAKTPMPAAVKEGFATTKATAEDIRPLNKALDWKGANAGVKATDRPEAEIAEAIKRVAASEGADVAKKALAAYKVRKAAADKRAGK